MGNDLSIVRAARVSYNADWRTGEDEKSDERLIRYLMKNRHTSPFESVEFQFEVKAPIFVFRQWHRHRTWSYNEVSARYTELPEEFYVPDPFDVGVQSKSNKQMRVRDGTSSSEDIRTCDEIKEACTASFEVYHRLLARGVPRELARSVLPLGTYSHMFAKVDLKNLFDWLILRDALDEGKHAQYEIYVYAEAILDLIEPVVPVTTLAWRDYSMMVRR
jgi:thymidylate synthase (FAD)